MQLARQNPGLNIIGLGAQDDLEFARRFVDRTNTGGGEITMVWDETFETWRALGVRSQPYWLLYDADGELIASGPGAVDESVVQSVLA